MTLSEKQAKFAVMVGNLLVWAGKQKDIRVRISWAYRDTDANRAIGGHPRSLHLSRLAIDLVLDKMEEGEWVYQKRTKDYTEIGEYWESIGGTWGGRFYDGGHFSLEHEGMK